jgi:hypothetical protein
MVGCVQNDRKELEGTNLPTDSPDWTNKKTWWCDQQESATGLKACVVRIER